MIKSTVRVGHGIDVHSFIAGRPLVLCCVNIPFEKGLDGFSDADVGTHAIIDSLLGAAGLGDIGTHFPDTDPKYLNISSKILLKRASELIRINGFEILNIDVTIVAQRPRINQYVPEMRREISSALNIPEASVSIKASTTEHLGFTGREEGILAFANATIAK